ncbi:hypothetical protein GMLC_34780 [Geomonas limicola]|uniref:Metallo-beta-lactamase domain-containing protein n=2 Tax=Geomonas limicola TaxID=2740186 RepID=A0A6V8NFY8_9BACT|nr:hypothetical protein GMLC_34780 [Geomonas limicola]
MVGEVHFYSTEIAGELVLFDTGPPTPEGRHVLEQAVDLKRVRHVFVTHCHVDHYGQAAFLQEQSDAEIYFPRRDVLRLRRLEDWIAGVHRLLREAGFSEEYCLKLQRLFLSQDMLAPSPRRYQVLEESNVPDRLGLEVLSCPGHSQSDVVYRYQGEAVTGDILLREIFQSPSLDLDVETFSGRFRNYESYCDSLVKLATLEGDLILPSHRQYLLSVKEALLFYVRKLIDRAGQVKRYAEIDLVSEVVQQIFGPTLTNPFVIYLKASEIYFMRDFLADPDRLRRALGDTGLFGQVADLFNEVVEG